MDADAPAGLVWHYTDAGGLLSILSGHQLWATSSRFLNDSGEVALGGRRLVEEVRRRSGENAFFRWLHGALESPGRHPARPSPEFFVLSAALDWDLLAVWRNYGGRGESYALGLDPSAPLAALCEGAGPAVPDAIRHRSWSPVRYADDDQHRLVEAVFDNLEDEVRRAQQLFEAGASPAELLAEVSELVDDMEQALLLTKHVGFTDERESRWSTVLYRRAGVDHPGELVRYRATPYGIAPYIRLTGAPAGTGPTVGAPSPLPVRALAISPSPHSRDSARSLRDLLEVHGYTGVPVVASAIPFRG
ncbi:hypothetical protein GIS00_23780 [Nakamurella sp. YIM 132087]|uniref:DUF2971 domain-containing protein n=1 Tax=Nakamurella alba TaxID=2665158 RepID=A0A7K1FSB0_9ACTN|nr:DUF2971 domain-containing protein [Nakamurella alba]MTD16960.1 hypothetical protein [Nakamurella alba]